MKTPLDESGAVFYRLDIETEKMKMKAGDKVYDQNGKMHTVIRVNKNGTVRVSFWNRIGVEVQCTCRREEFN